MNVNLKWTRDRRSVVPTSRTGLDREGISWSVCVDSPYRGTWHVRIWRDGTLAKFWDATTLRNAKQGVADFLAGAK